MRVHKQTSYRSLANFDFELFAKLYQSEFIIIIKLKWKHNIARVSHICFFTNFKFLNELSTYIIVLYAIYYYNLKIFIIY